MIAERGYLTGTAGYMGNGIMQGGAMARATKRDTEANRAAIYARVSGRSQAGDDKTSISEQVADMEAYCESKGLAIVARYQEVGKGWSKKRPEFQRMLADARQGHFDTIVCWKSDRLSRGMYPAAALMEVVEAYRIRLEAVMDAIDMKTFGLMAAIGKIELDNFRERAAMGKRGAAKQGRIPNGSLPYGYRIGDNGRPEIVESEAEVVRRIFRQYVHEGMGSTSIAWQLMDDGVPAPGGMRWHQAYVHNLLGNRAYKGVWSYGQTRQMLTEQGRKVYEQPRDTWIEVPVPPLVDEETWDRVQGLKKQRRTRSRRNTKEFYLLQHLLRCAECGQVFNGRANRHASARYQDKVYRYNYPNPKRYYICNGVRKHRLHCREKPHIRAEQLEERVWGEVRRVLQDPGVIVAGLEALDDSEGSGLEGEIARVERELRNVQTEEDRAIRLYVAGKITEEQLDLQRKFITERLEGLRAKLEDYRAREEIGSEKRDLMEAVLAWAREVGEGLQELTPDERRELLQMVVEDVMVDGGNNLDITLAIPVGGSGAIVSSSSE